MADNDLLLIDSTTPTPVPFAPESTDQGTNAAGKPVRRSMFGMKDGAHVSFGSIGDVPQNADTWTTANISFLRVFRAFWRDMSKLLSGTLTTKAAAPTPVASAGYVTNLVKAGVATVVNVHASNASQTVEGYLVVIDAAAAPAAGAAITPLKKRRLPTNDGTSPGTGIDGTAEIDTPFAVTTGLVVLLTTSLTNFVPGTLTGVIDASTLA